MMARYCPYCVNPVEGSWCKHCNKDIDSVNNGTNLPIGGLLEGKYRIGRVLGQGGFGVTYIARNIALDTIVAIKEYFPSLWAQRVKDSWQICALTNDDQGTDFENGKKKFIDEGRNLASMKELAHVVDVFDYFEANGTGYLVMEYVPGVKLSTVIKNPNHGPFEMSELETLIKPLMKDMAIMHRKHLLHRDITPANIIMSGGKLVLIDFGSARRMEGNKTMSVFVTQGYAPLEQFTSGVQTSCTDVYSLAGTIYTCLTGKVPQGAIARAFRDEMVFPREQGIKISQKQNDALKKAMALRYGERTQTIDEFMEELFEEEDVVPIKTVVQESLPKAEERWTKKFVEAVKRKKMLLLGCLAAICVIAMVAVGVNYLEIPSGSEHEEEVTQLPDEVSQEAPDVIEVERIELFPNSLDVKVGATGTFSVSVFPSNADNQTITWSSSAPNVVSVGNDGTYTALASGTAIIAASTSNGKSAEATVYVTEEHIYVESVTMTDSIHTMKVGETYQLSVQVEPENAEDGALTWSSGKESVATVDQNGNVTAVGEGMAIITAATASGKQASCQIVVISMVITSAPLTTPEPSQSNGDYVIPDSSTRKLTEADLKDLTWRELGLARNEIYARHGYDFDSGELADYFNSKSWYEGTTTDASKARAEFNKIEMDNVDIIKTYEVNTYGSTYAFEKD